MMMMDIYVENQQWSFSDANLALQLMAEFNASRALKTCLEARTCLENENPCLEKSGSVLQFLQAYLCSFI